jgi:phage regulator Rha-like protein
MAKAKTIVKFADGYIANKILIIRGEKVMLDRDLAELYGVSTKRLKEQVKRNISRFPKNFMFQLTSKEFKILRSQIATSSWGGSRYLPYLFTEHGVLMLANILKSERAIQMSVRIIEVFVKMREIALTHKDILIKLQQIEKKVTEHDGELSELFEAVRQLLVEPKKERVKVGFKIPPVSK